MCLYFYFHLYLDNLWEELAGLPAYFPDGKRIDQRAYPWLLVTLVRKHFKRLKERPLIAKIKEWIGELKQPKWNWHGLRHRRASIWAHEGKPLFELQMLLGHTQISTTQRYLHSLGIVKV
jgi:site-specific recombinase XerD